MNILETQPARLLTVPMYMLQGPNGEAIKLDLKANLKHSMSHRKRYINKLTDMLNQLTLISRLSKHIYTPDLLGSIHQASFALMYTLHPKII